jgi:hypothetical protein
VKPDWGHGPNPPVRMFTEDQIRAAMTLLRIGPTLTDHVINRLKEDNL